VLDQWARALDVTNDLDAMHKLRGLMNDLDDARSQLQKTTKVLAAVPDPDANTRWNRPRQRCCRWSAGSPSTREEAGEPWAAR
jgi:hypothetical protein